MAIEIAEMNIKACRQIVHYGDLSTAATTNNVKIWQPPITSYLVGLWVRVNTAFAGVTKPQLKMGFGTSNDTDVLMAEQRIDSVGYLQCKGNVNFTNDPGKGQYCQVQDFLNPPGNIQSRVFYANFSSSSGNLSSLTAGELEIVMLVLMRK